MFSVEQKLVKSRWRRDYNSGKILDRQTLDPSSMNRPIAVSFLAALFLFTGSVFSETRSWTNKNGVSIEAEFASQENGVVTIRRATDRLEFEILIATLSAADQKWLADTDEATSTPGEGIYIAAGNGAHRLSSLDGVRWTNHVFLDKPAHDQNDLKAIAIGDETCVVVGGFSKSNIFTTSNGVDWEKSPYNIGVLSGVLFVGDRFLVFGEGGRVAESKNGIEWEQIGDAKLRDFQKSEAEKLGAPEVTKSNIRRWRHANGIFVGAGDNCIIVSTKDFQTWNFAERLQPQSRLFIESDENGFVVRGNRTLHHSTDGMNWTDVTPELEEKIKFNSLLHDGERFIVNSRSGESWESPTGEEWKLVKGETFPGTLATLRPDLYYAFETYWKYTEDLKISRDGGKSWKSCELPDPAGITNIIFAEGFPKFSLPE